MNNDPKRPADRPDAFLEARDPVERSALSGDGIERALDEMGAEIASRSRQATSRRTRRLSITRPRTALVIGFATIGIGAAVAGGSQLSARTGHFQPTPQEIAKASPEKAKRMKSYLEMGGPGEWLNPAGGDFHDVALKVASDIPWPDGYLSWRDSLISNEERTADGATESSGALHGWFAMSAFCAWVLDWRHADMTGDSETAAKAAQVISEAPSWKAVTDEDPHPDATVPGDMGSIQSTLFGWMLPYRDAVQASDRTRVDHLLATNEYSGRCQVYDPGWNTLVGAHPGWRTLSSSELQQKYAQYLASRTS
jgi:hypothetical protein